MVKINWDEDAALRLNAGVTSALALGHLVLSKETSNLFYTSAAPRASMMHTGNTAVLAAAACGMAVNSVDRNYKRKLLNAAGVSWLACGATHVWAWKNKHEKKDVALTSAGLAAGLAAASFAAGCRNNTL